MSQARWDETWHRLRDWTNGQGRSERLAAQILAAEGYQGLDPTHPLGGKDGGQDGTCTKDGKRWSMAVYFPRGEKSIREIEEKFRGDLEGARKNAADGIAFVTNQELRRAERTKLAEIAGQTGVDLFHIERVVGVLDRPDMAGIRKQFLEIGDDDGGTVNLGGEGGRAPGAGGGGGGAIGSGARGGKGGRGGNTKFYGPPPASPGAGGGGIGAVGENARGAEGGGGGERIVAQFGPGDLPKGVPIKIKVGRGGRFPGEDGEDTTFGDFLRAKGGRAGRPVINHPTARSVGADDIAKGLRIVGTYLADCVHLKKGLLYLLSAGWEFYPTTALPVDVQWPIVYTISFGATEPGTALRFDAIVVDPSGREVERQEAIAERGNGPVCLRHCFSSLRFTATVAGIWMVNVVSGDLDLASVPIEIKLLPR